MRDGAHTCQQGCVELRIVRTRGANVVCTSVHVLHGRTYAGSGAPGSASQGAVRTALSPLNPPARPLSSPPSLQVGPKASSGPSFSYAAQLALSVNAKLGGATTRPAGRPNVSQLGCVGRGSAGWRQRRYVLVREAEQGEAAGLAMLRAWAAQRRMGTCDGLMDHTRPPQLVPGVLHLATSADDPAAPGPLTSACPVTHCACFIRFPPL